MASPTPVTFVPLYTPEAARSSPNNRHPSPPFSRTKHRFDDPSSGLSATGEEAHHSLLFQPVTTFSQAEKLIADLRQQIIEEQNKNKTLMVAVSKGPGALAERIKVQEDRARQNEELANLRTIQLNDVAESLRKTLEDFANFRDEADEVLAESSEKIRFLTEQIDYNQLHQQQQQHATNKKMEELMKNSSEMAEFILQQTSTIDRMSYDLSALRDHAKREKTNAEIQQRNLEATIETLRGNLLESKAETRAEQERAKKIAMDKDAKILRLVDMLRQEEDKTKAEKLASQLELERNKRESDRSMNVTSKETRELRLRAEEQDGVILKLRMQIKSLQDDLDTERQAVMSSKKALHEARAVADEHASRHQKSIEETRTEHESTKNLHEQQRREWAATRERLDLRIAEAAQENEALRRTLQEKELTVRELTTRFDRAIEEHLEEKSKIKKQAEEEVGYVETHKKSLKEQHEQLQENFKASREEVRTLNAALRQTRAALVAGGDEQEKAIRKLRADLEENIKEQRLEKTHLQRKVEEEDSKIHQLQKQLSELSSGAEDAGTMSELQKAIDRHEKSKRELENQMQVLDDLLVQQLDDLGALVKARDAKDLAFAEVSQKLDDAKREQEEERTEFSKTKREMQSNVDSLTLEKKSLARERDDIESALAHQKDAYERTARDLEAVKSSLEKEQSFSKERALQEMKMELETSLRTHQRDREQLQDELSNKAKEIETLQEQVRNISSSRQEFQKQLEEVKKEYEEKLQGQSREIEKKKLTEKETIEVQEKLKERERELEIERRDASDKSQTVEQEVRTISRVQREKFRSLLKEFESVLKEFSLDNDGDDTKDDLEFDPRSNFESIKNNFETFTEREELLLAKLHKIASHHVDKLKALEETEENLNSTTRKFQDYKQEAELSKEYKDALTSAELRRQLEKTKDQLRSLIRTHQLQPIPEGLMSTSASSSSPMFHAAGRTSPPYTSSSSNENKDNNNNSAFIRYNNLPRSHELSQGSVLNVDSMKELAKTKWQVVSETYCPGAPTAEQVWMQKNPEIVEKYTNSNPYAHDDYLHYGQPVSGYRSGSSTKSHQFMNNNNNPQQQQRGTSEDWIKTKTSEHHQNHRTSSQQQQPSSFASNPLDEPFR